MSRIGKIPVAIPDGVTVTTDGSQVTVKGPKGTLERALTGGIRAKLDGKQLALERPNDEAQTKALHGLFRSLCQGMVTGVVKGYEKKLEIVGVSYQASVDGKRLKLQVGFSHPLLFDIPPGLKVECPSATLVVVSGPDKQAVGQFAATVRKSRPPEPYKGKGVRYQGEQVVQKQGKSFVGGEK